MSDENENIIIYHTADGKTNVSLYAKDGTVWMNKINWQNFLTPRCQISVCIYLIY